MDRMPPRRDRIFRQGEAQTPREKRIEGAAELIQLMCREMVAQGVGADVLLDALASVLLSNMLTVYGPPETARMLREMSDDVAAGRMPPPDTLH